MSRTAHSTLRVVLYEGANAQPLEAEDRFTVLTALLEKGFAVTRAAAGGQVAPHPQGPLLVLGQFANGHRPEAEVAAAESPVRFENITGLGAEQIAGTAEEVRAGVGAAKHGEWKPWFPVIDYDRCTNCMQCLSFCLFGVYGVDQQHRIHAQNHDNCKPTAPPVRASAPKRPLSSRNTRPAPLMATWCRTPISAKKR
jgi:Pyruvate/2-oxoacid:ferredoxin oxidoreductase delta subunit